MAPSANPKTRIRGAMNNFPAGKQKANHLESLKLKLKTISAMLFNITMYVIV